MKLKKILHSLTSFVTIFALTSGIIVTYAPAGAEDLTVDDIKDRITSKDVKRLIVFRAI